MDQGRRAEYRVELSGSSELRVAVASPGGDEIRGQLIDVSASGAGAVFEAPDPPNLAVGQDIDLVFTSDTFKGPVTVAARVQHRAEDKDNDGSRRFGFRFLEPQQLNARLPAAARRLFNRRQNVRVAPDQFHPVGVTGIISIAESHLCIHTWPEHGYAAVDIFTCGSEFKPREAATSIISSLQCANPEITEIQRGLVSEPTASPV